MQPENLSAADPSEQLAENLACLSALLREQTRIAADLSARGLLLGGETAKALRELATAQAFLFRELAAFLFREMSSPGVNG